ncbi:YdcF family protein [Chroococcus sp. FPU101]|uniref:YdcF family protein n=1 Tax=Chroococcus sp. FPU101 TaxID=1974212 RepID=UPI001A902EE7|nr:YdcF family protein [Chroococcus sp. FPU101]GFE71288.1 protein of unknown function DUF218 [Chroococcus sp. FPU101]
MFLLLSKLLPVFIYPLGLATFLLIIALFLLWRRSRFVEIPLFLAVFIILTASNGIVSTYLVQSLEWQNIPATLPKAEAIVLLGGSTKSASYPRPMVDINEQGDRVIYAAKLYLTEKAPLIIAAGGRIKWLSTEQPESADMGQLLELMGVPNSAIIQESESLNTYENAVNVKKIVDERGIKKILLVTSALHMPRSLAIFKHQGIEAIAAPTDFLVSYPDLESLNQSLPAILLNLIPNANYLEQTTKAIKEYIGIYIYHLKGWI